MEVIGILLKSGVSIDLDEGTSLNMVNSSEQRNWQRGRMVSPSAEDHINMDHYVEIETVTHLRLQSKGNIWLIRDSEVAGFKYKNNPEEESFKGEIKI